PCARGWRITRKTGPAAEFSRGGRLRSDYEKREETVMLSPETIHTYVDILREELVPATGCTEPIAIAYAAALLRQTLGAAPERVLAEVSGNIIKNVKSVIVPNTGGLKGIQAAVAAGVVAGRADQILQVISDVPEDKLGDIARYAKETPIQVECAHTPRLLDIVLT